MLNEIKEFDEYKKVLRLKTSVIQDDLSGLKRAFEILAIYYLAEAKEKNIDDKIEYTKNALEEWTEKKFTPYAIKTLKITPSENTLSDVVSRQNKRKTIEHLNNKISDFKSPILHSSYDRKSDTRSNSNENTYERAIANALSVRGYDGLKRYYLVCDNDLLNKEHILVKNKITDKVNAYDTIIDVVSKMTASYLLKKKQINDSKELRLTQADIFNWIVQGNYKQYFSDSSYYMIQDNIKIFTKIQIGNKTQNAVKYYCAPQWIKHFDVIEEDKLDRWLERNKNNPNKHFYSDWGASTPLKKDKRYRKQKG